MSSAAQITFTGKRRRKSRPAVERLLERCVETADGCWQFTGPLMKNGYSRVWVTGEDEKRLGHRVSYEHFIAPIPHGLVLDHTCRNRACVNPWHLDPVTDAVNIRRGESISVRHAERERCNNGHRYTPENTHLTMQGRKCRTCDADRARARRRAMSTKRSNAA